MKVGIINVTGYSGAELARILRRHPEVEIASVTGRSAAGQKLGEVFPHLESLDLTIEPELSGSLDLVFSALPHKASAEACIPVLDQGVKVVDISADFRLKQADEYEEWYGVAHQKPSLLEEAVYGLTELHRDEIRSARLVANPGCYPTSAILALAPAVDAGIISPDIIVSSLSGVSGGGAQPHDDQPLLGSERERLRLCGERAPPPAGDHTGTRPAGRAAGAGDIPGSPDPDDARHLQLLLRSAGQSRRMAGDEGRQRLVDIYREFYADHHSRGS